MFHVPSLWKQEDGNLLVKIGRRTLNLYSLPQFWLSLLSIYTKFIDWNATKKYKATGEIYESSGCPVERSGKFMSKPSMTLGISGKVNFWKIVVPFEYLLLIKWKLTILILKNKLNCVKINRNTTKPHVKPSLYKNNGWARLKYSTKLYKVREWFNRVVCICKGTWIE